MAKVKCEPGFTQLTKFNVLEPRKLTVDGEEVEVINTSHFTTPIQATFDTVNSFSMTRNHTEEFQIGRRVQFDSGQSDVNCNVNPEDLTPDDIFTVNKFDYSIITAIQYDGVITDVTIADSILTSDLEEASVSINWVDSQAGLITTTDLINSMQGYQSDFVLETNGFTTSGDNGGAKWMQNGVIAQTPSQTPAQLGDALLNDGNGNQWAFVGSALFAEQVGGVLDGATDNTLIALIAVNWSTITGGNFYIGLGEFSTSSQVLVSSNQELNIRGLNRDKSICKLLDGSNSHNFQLAGDGTGRLTIKNLTIDGNMDNNTGNFHGIRSAGCEKLHLTDVLIKDALFYGVGIQVGTNKDVRFTDLEVRRCGSDGIDIKDGNLDNETVQINGYKCSGHGAINTDSPALDTRCGVIATNIDVVITGNNNGFNFRGGDGITARGGFGSISNAMITGDGISISSGIICESATSAFTYSNITIDNCFRAVRQTEASVGGIINGLTAKNIYGVDSVTLGGTDLIMSNFNVSNKTGNSRVVDIEATAVNIQLTNFLIEDTVSIGDGIRVISGAVDCLIASGTIRNAILSDSGTSTVVSNVRIL